MKILALSTSSPRGSAALLDIKFTEPEGLVLATAAYEDLRGHAERIFAAVDEVLAAAGASRADIAALACDVGPGSFTGVRVAVASARGIALALGIHPAGVSSLEAMAAAAFAGPAAPGDLVVPVIDAKKGEVFLAVFAASGADPERPARSIIEARIAPCHLRREEAEEKVAALTAGARVVVIGAVAEELPALRPHLARGPGLDLPDAAWIGRAAIPRLVAPEPGAAGLEPLYVRAPDAKPADLGYAPPR